MPSAGWSGRDLRSAIVRHRSLSLLMFSSAAFRSATCCSARSARSASGVVPLGVSGFDGARDDAAAVASVCMRRCLSVQMDDAGNGALVRLIVLACEIHTQHGCSLAAQAKRWELRDAFSMSPRAVQLRARSATPRRECPLSGVKRTWRAPRNVC